MGTIIDSEFGLLEVEHEGGVIHSVKFVEQVGGIGNGGDSTSDEMETVQRAPEEFHEPVDVMTLFARWLDSMEGTPPPHMQNGTTFQELVWEEISRVPYGETATYAEIAERVGRPRAVRATASACARNHLPLIIPCHRVVKTDGTMGGYLGGKNVKRRLLEKETTPTTAILPNPTGILL